MTDHRPPGSRSVRRNLFGRDPNVPLDDLAKEREELSKRQESNFKEQWNFDLTNCRPLNGKYEWSEAIPLNSPSLLLSVPNTGVNSEKNISPTLPIASSGYGHVAPASTSLVCDNSQAATPPAKRQRPSDSGAISSKFY